MSPNPYESPRFPGEPATSTWSPLAAVFKAILLAVLALAIWAGTLLVLAIRSFEQMHENR
jgi:hypothetical protein